ncbi:hypothetical protein AAY473_040639 [Plecturocebus cupreus]
MSVIPALWEAKAGRPQGQGFETSLANMGMRNTFNAVNYRAGKIKVSLFHPCQSALVRSQLSATSISRVQRWGFTMLARLVSNFRPQVIHPGLPKCWYYRREPLHPANAVLFVRLSRDRVSLGRPGCKTGSCYVSHTGFKLLASSDLSASAFQSVGITGMSHCVQPLYILTFKIQLKMLLICVIKSHDQFPFKVNLVVLVQKSSFCMPNVCLKNTITTTTKSHTVKCLRIHSFNKCAGHHTGHEKHDD